MNVAARRHGEWPEVLIGGNLITWRGLMDGVYGDDVTLTLAGVNPRPFLILDRLCECEALCVCHKAFE